MSAFPNEPRYFGTYPVTVETAVRPSAYSDVGRAALGPSVLDYDARSPWTMHPDLAASMFGKPYFERAEGPVLNVAAGQTELQTDLYKQGIRASVFSIDPIYATNKRYTEREDRIPAVAENIPYDDETFAATLCQFGLQHMRNVPAAIREMIRVTKTGTDMKDHSKGTILLNPVFKPKQLTKAIFDQGLEDVCGILYPGLDVTEADKTALPTLVIKKTSALTETKINELISALSETSALNKRKTAGEIASRIFSGHTKH